jgi:hypothetical protein
MITKDCVRQKSGETLVLSKENRKIIAVRKRLFCGRHYHEVKYHCVSMDACCEQPLTGSEF